jgi:PKD repeat protein
MRNSAVQRDDETVYVIPVVFHVIHAGGTENIPDAQIFAEVEDLNEDFRKLNADLSETVPFFQQVAGDVKVEFRLAQIDPNGNCTNGINRIFSPLTLVGDDGAKQDYWPRNKYLNVWTVRQMGGGAAGYAYYPNALTGLGVIFDGVIMLSGGIGANQNVLTHEIGHVFNLAHTWGANVAGIEGTGDGFMVNQCSDDDVQDTPLTKGHDPSNCRLFDHTCSAQAMRFTAMTFANMTDGGTLVDNTPIATELDTIFGEVPLVVSNMTASGVGSSNRANGAFGTNNWGVGAEDGTTTLQSLTGNLDPAKYYEFTIDPNLPYSHRINQITFRARRDSTGPRTFAVRASRSNTFSSNMTALNSLADTNITLAPSNVFFIDNDTDLELRGCRVSLSSLYGTGSNQETDQTITVRIYAWNAEDTEGGFYIDSLFVNGNFGRIENVQNYMEYSYCSTMFTQGQVDRMRATLNSMVGDRMALWQPDNLVATGTNDGFVATCPPIADFIVNNTDQAPPYAAAVCSNSNVSFRDMSGGGPATSWEWTFQDGQPATSTAENPTVQFSGDGWKTVTLTVSNQYGSTTKSEQFAINISSAATNIGPATENFESDENIFPFYAENYASNHTSWEVVSGVGFNSNRCVRLNSGDRNQLDLRNPSNAQDIDDLVSPTINYSGLSNMSLSFRYAYSTQTTVLENVTENLKVQRSFDCGRTWTDLPGGTIADEELLVEGNNSGTPTAWRQKTINLTQAMLGPNVRFRWRFTSSAFSNDIYIDDINFGSSAVSVDEPLGNTVAMSLFPNPTNDHFTLQVSGMEDDRTEVTVMDIRGAQVYTNVYQPTGGANIELSAKDMGLSNGMYMLRVANSTGSSTTKLIIGE